MLKRSVYPALFLALVALAGYHTPVFGHGSSALPLGGPPLRSTVVHDVLPIESPIPFVNFENGHVHPLDLAGNTLVAVNTAANRLEVFDVTSGVPVQVNSIPVGYDPVSARFQQGDNNLVWVVNHISDSISVVNLSSGVVERTLQTKDEPADVVFATLANINSGNPVAMVTCSSLDVVQIWNPVTYTDLALDFEVAGEDPRGLATSPSGDKVYAAVFESGNHSTIIRDLYFNNLLANEATSPYFGEASPPYNNGIPGTAWVTPHGSENHSTIVNNALSPLPTPSHIVRFDVAQSKWVDDNNADFTKFITDNFNWAALTGRPLNWDMLDNDIAVIEDDGIGGVDQTHATDLMNIVMAIAVSPDGSKVVTVGTDATNEIRFEPVLNGTFVRVLVAITDANGANATVIDMNEEHLDAAQIAQDGGGASAYHDHTVPQSERNKSIGDPRGVAFNAAGTRLYVTGMGSNNVVILNPATGLRTVTGQTIEVGKGPTGIVHHSGTDRLFVLNKFEGSISTIDATVDAEAFVSTVPFFDPTPKVIKDGRPHLYSTHDNSGLGQIACGSCHIDGRMDRLAWDLGDPTGSVKPVTMAQLLSGGADQHNQFDPFGAGDEFDDFHPMKGPMTTQTLQDIIGKEPLHWRGDKTGVEQFAGAFDGLQGDDDPLDTIKMQQFEDFLASLHFGPNPFRAPDNTFIGGPNTVGGTNTGTIPLPRHYSHDRFSARGTAMPAGDPWNGFSVYVNKGIDGGATCVQCHTLPLGSGSTHFTPNNIGQTLVFQEIPTGPLGESHLAMVHQDGTGQKHMKTAHLRNQFDKEGFTMDNLSGPSRAGFGVLHDGSAEGLTRFISSSVFSVASDQEISDLVAFCLSVNGGFAEVLPLLDQLATPLPNGFMPGPPGGQSKTAHASVGKQRTIRDGSPPSEDTDWITWAIGRADAEQFGIVAHGVQSSEQRSWAYASGTGGSAVFESDRRGETTTHSGLLALAGTGTEVTFTIVPNGLEARLGQDRDFDGGHDGDETDFNTDPANPDDHKWVNLATSGTMFGTELMPYNNFDDGVNGLVLSPGQQGVLHLQATTYNVPTTLNTRMTLVAENGLVTLN